MTYVAREESIEDGQPIEIYDLVIGTDIYRFTSAQDAQVISSQTYTPVAMQREETQLGPDSRTRVLSITMPATEEFVQLYSVIPPGQKAVLTIRRFHRGDSDPPVVEFKGLVRAVGRDTTGDQATLHVLPLMGRMTKNVPRYKFTSLCNHVLFDSGCKVVQNDFRYSGTANTTANPLEITVGGLDASKGVGWATGGFVSFPDSGDFRGVYKHSATDKLLLIIPFRDSVNGESVDVFAGCAHTLAVCTSKFSNPENYGGFNWVPVKNIFITGVE